MSSLLVCRPTAGGGLLCPHELMVIDFADQKSTDWAKHQRLATHGQGHPAEQWSSAPGKGTALR